MVEHLAKAFDDPLTLMSAAGLDVPPDRFARLTNQAAATAEGLRVRDHELVRQVLQRVVVRSGSASILCSRHAIQAALGLGAGEGRDEVFTISVSVRLTRTGSTMRLIEGGQPLPRVDPALVRLLVQARRYWLELRKGEINVTELAAREKITPAYVTRVLRLAFLAPAVVDAMLAGRQRIEASVGKLVATEAIDPLWSIQGRALVAVAS